MNERKCMTTRCTGRTRHGNRCKRRDSSGRCPAHRHRASVSPRDTTSPGGSENRSEVCVVVEEEDSNDSTNADGGECSICLDSIDLSSNNVLVCGHSFHAACIRRWFDTSSVCPLCRRPLIIDRPPDRPPHRMSALRAIEMFGLSDDDNDGAGGGDVGVDLDVDEIDEEFDWDLDRQLEELLQLEIVGIGVMS